MGFEQTFAKGAATHFGFVWKREAFAAPRLTLLTGGIAVPVNLVFGLAAVRAVAKFESTGRRVVITLVDRPFAVSPMISETVSVFLSDPRGLADHGSTPTGSRLSSRLRS